MAKIRLTKNELKKQKDNLRRFLRYLPTLDLKKKQLIQEIQRINRERDELQRAFDTKNEALQAWVDVFADAIDLQPFLQVERILMDEDNIAGIDIPLLQDLRFEEAVYDFMETPLWVDRGIETAREQVLRKARIQNLEHQQDILQEELRITIQRMKLFEEVKIPEASENIRIIQIFLGDLQTAEVVRGKIAKAKIEKKKMMNSGAA